MKGLIIIKAFFVVEADKPSKIDAFLNKVQHDGDMIIVPNVIKEKNIIKIIKKIQRICIKNEVNSLVLSKKLKQEDALIKKIEKNCINVFDGKWLFEYLVYEVMQYLVNKLDKKKEKTEIAILVNYASKEAVENIKLLAKEYKRINIVTNHIDNFKRLENELYEQYGVIITITNNKRKSLLKSEIIINFDFVEERLNKYNINDNAVIVNIPEEIKIHKKRFNGTCIHNYELKSKKAEGLFEITKLKKFDLKDLVEERLYRKDTFSNIRKDIVKGLYEIKELNKLNGNF